MPGQLSQAAPDRVGEHDVEGRRCAALGCWRTLRADEAGICAVHLGALRRDLADLAQDWPVLASMPLGSPRSARFDETRSAARERPLPGGDALVLRGPGGWRGSGGRGSASGDAGSVSGVVAYWRMRVVLFRREAPTRDPGVPAALAYLRGPALDAFAAQGGQVAEMITEMAALRSRVRVAIGDSDRSLRGAVPCVQCGTLLVREELDDGSRTNRPAGQVSTTRGQSEVWTCPRCREQVSADHYWLAVRAALEARRDPGRVSA